MNAGVFVTLIATLFIGLIVGLLGGSVAILISVTALFAASVLWNYRIGVVLAVLMLPLSSTQLFPRAVLGITGLNPLNVVLVATVFSFCIAWLSRRRDNEVPGFPSLWWLFILPIALAAFHGMFYVDEIPGYYRTFDIVQYDSRGGYLLDQFFKPMIIIAVALLVSIVARNAQRPALLLIPLFLPVVALELAVLGYVAISGMGLDALASGSRRFLSWTGMHANELGLMFNIMLALALFTFIQVQPRMARLLLAGVIGASALAIVLTFSRGAYLGLLVTAAYFLVSRRKIRWIFAGLMFAAAVALILPEAVFQRASKGVDTGNLNQASAGRIDMIWKPLAPTIAESPLIGHGLGSTVWSTPAKRGNMLPVGHPHSAYLRVFLDLGIAGALLLAVFYRRLWRLFRQARAEQKEPALGGLFEGASVCLMVLAVQGLTDSSFTPTFSQSPMWLAVGLAIGLLPRREPVNLPAPARSVARYRNYNLAQPRRSAT